MSMTREKPRQSNPDPCPAHSAGHSYGWDASDACAWCASPRPSSWRRTRRLIRSIVRGLS